MTKVGGATVGVAALAAIVGLITGLAAAGVRLVFVQSSRALLSPGTAAGPGVIALLVVLPSVGALIAHRLWHDGNAVPGAATQDFLDPSAALPGRVSRAARRFAAALITVTTGGSAGVEGALAWVGSSAGAGAGTWLRMDTYRINVLGACGLAASVAGLLHAPITGMLFAGELVLGGYGVRSMLPLGVASFGSWFVARTVLRGSAPLTIPDYQLITPLELPLHLLVGVLAGLAGALLVGAVRRSSALVGRLRLPTWVQPAVGGLVVGGISVFWPMVRGTGYPELNGLFVHGAGAGLAFTWLLAKTAATSATVGSGGVGGVMGPSLLMGAALGHGFGAAAQRLIPGSIAPASSYALIGASAMVAITVRAPVTAIVLALEWTGNYLVALPATVAVVSAVFLSSLIQRARPDSPLGPRGPLVLAAEGSRQLHVQVVRDLTRPSQDVVPIDMPMPEVLRCLRLCRDGILVVVDPGDGGRIAGVVNSEDVRPLLGSRSHDEGTARELVVPVEELKEQHTLAVALSLFTRSHLPALPVVDEEHRVRGVITRYDVMDVCAGELLRGYVGIDPSAPAPPSAERPQHHQVCALPVPRPFLGRSLRDIDLARKWGVSCIGLRRANDRGDLTPLPLDSARPLRAGEVLILAGEPGALERVRMLERATERPPAPK